MRCFTAQSLAGGGHMAFFSSHTSALLQDAGDAEKYKDLLIVTVSAMVSSLLLIASEIAAFSPLWPLVPLFFGGYWYSRSALRQEGMGCMAQRLPRPAPESGKLAASGATDLRRDGLEP